MDLPHKTTEKQLGFRRCISVEYNVASFGFLRLLVTSALPNLVPGLFQGLKSKMAATVGEKVKKLVKTKELMVLIVTLTSVTAIMRYCEWQTYRILFGNKGSIYTSH